MNYDKDSISILKQSSFIGCNYLCAAIDGSEVSRCFIEKCAFPNYSFTPFIKNSTSCRAAQLIIQDNMHCVWNYFPIETKAIARSSSAPFWPQHRGIDSNQFSNPTLIATLTCGNKCERLSSFHCAFL